MTKTLAEMTKEELAALAASLFTWQSPGPATIVELADRFPWLVDASPNTPEAKALVACARKGRMPHFKTSECLHRVQEMARNAVEAEKQLDPAKVLDVLDERTDVEYWELRRRFEGEWYEGYEGEEGP